MSKKLLLTLGVFVFSGFLISLLNASKVYAAVSCTWNGSASSDWTDVANWDIVSGCPGVPVVNNYGVVFPAGVTNKTVNNVPDGLVIHTITVDGNYTINGTSAHILSGINSTSAYFSLNLAITLDASQTFKAGHYKDINLNGFDLTLDSTNDSIDLGGVISGTGNIIVNSTANHVIGFSHASTFEGAIDVYDNGVTIAANNALGDAANILTMHSNAQYLFLSGGFTTPNPIVLYDVTGIDNMSGDNTLSGSITIAGDGVGMGAESGTLTLSGNLLGTYSATFSKNVNFTGDGALYLGTLGILLNKSYINGTIGGTVELSSGGTLAGTGTVGAIVGAGGNVAPGNSPGIITVVGNMTLTNADSLQFEINGTTVGTQYDQIQVGGTTDLGNSTLDLTLGYVPTGGTTYVLIDSVGSITGTFNGLPNGSVVSVGGQDFIINYTTNQVTLSAVGGSISTEISNISFNPTNPATGQNVTISVTVGTNFQMPTGTVELFDGLVSLGTANVVGGVAVFNISNFSTGSHSITAVYSGDLLHDSVTSSPSILLVGSLANTGIRIPVVIILLLIISSLGLRVVILRKQMLKSPAFF